VYAVVALLVISVATEVPDMLSVVALTEVAVTAEALTAVEFAVKLPLTVNPFLTTKLLSAISVPYPLRVFVIYSLASLFHYEGIQFETAVL
jgi:hypothetical protein